MTRYTASQLSFLKQGYKEMRVPRLTDAFNQEFGTSKTNAQIRAALRNHRFTCGRAPGFKKGENITLLNDEQITFLREKYRENSLSVVTKLINAEFDLNVTFEQLRAFTKNHKINSGRDGRFQKGHVSWNQGTKGMGVCKPNSGCFKKGQTPINKKSFGHERVCSKDGYLLVKVNEVNPYTGAQGWYRPKHKVIWEQHKGPIPKGMIIRFRDGNKLNPAIENLEMVSQAVNLRLNQSGYSDLVDELKPVAKSIAELEVKTFEKMKEAKRGNA